MADDRIIVGLDIGTSVIRVAISSNMNSRAR